MSTYGSAVDGWYFFLDERFVAPRSVRNFWMNPWQLRVCMCVCVRVLSLVWLLHSCRLLTCKTGSVAWLRRSLAPSLFQRRRPIAAWVLYSLALSLSFNPTGRLPSAVCRLLELLKRSRTMFCSFWCWASVRALSLARSAASSLARSAASSLARSAASSVWCCCSCVHYARNAAVARKWLALGLRARST